MLPLMYRKKIAHLASRIMSINTLTKLTQLVSSNDNLDKKEYNLPCHGSRECKDPDAGGNIDNYGSYCCYNTSFHGCPSELQIISEIWLGDIIP
jgi:hypothetical protein